MTYKKFILVFLMLPLLALAQEREKDRDYREDAFEKLFGIIDRAGGSHNASNIGLFFENRGKLYPRRLSQGPSGEYPINSGKHYIYRINPMVGVPGNVIQGRYTTNEEWEAVAGYNNTELAKIAFSDAPATWHPVNGWPFKDADGNPVIKSDQDSYCKYDDAKNTMEVLGVSVGQTGYTYGVKFAQNLIFYTFVVKNEGTKFLDSVYFGLYTDIDVGNVSGGTPEYLDDKLGYNREKNFVYYYDAKGFSSEWPGGESGYFGVAFLKTPLINGVMAGVTDMHYNLYDDDRDIDSVQYGIMASTPGLYNSSLGSKYFHLGSQSSLRFDDTATIPVGGLDLVATISSGPYTLNPGDSLVFVTAIIAGDTYQDAMATLTQAEKILAFDFEISKPPATPKLAGYASDKQNFLYWDNAAEKSRDNFSGEYDFEGYRIYRSLDKGVNWDLLADYDMLNQRGLDRGLQYSYRDTTVNNGFEYWYTVTAYDRGDSLIESLESPLGKNLTSVNTIALIPATNAAGRTPVSVNNVTHTGNGISNYEVRVTPRDDDQLKDNVYEVGFSFQQTTIRGKLNTIARIEVTDSARNTPARLGIEFKSPTVFNLIDLNTGDFLRENQSYIAGPNATFTIAGQGMRLRLIEPDPSAPAELKPKAGDYIQINFSVHAIKNGVDTVAPPRPLIFDRPQSTTDGLVFSVSKPDIIRDVSRVGGTDKIDMAFSVEDETLLKTVQYLVRVTGSGYTPSGNPFVSIYVDSVNAADATPVLRVDTLENLAVFSFDGIRGRVDFRSTTAPAVGNAFSVDVLRPVLPNLRDRYQITLTGSSYSKETAAAAMSNIKVVPNPYIVSSLFEPEFGELRREPLRQIQFINLPPEATIYIFTLDADLVKTIYHYGPSGTATWDLRAEGGREIAPGMYIYMVKSDAGEYIHRFAVIK